MVAWEIKTSMKTIFHSELQFVLFCEIKVFQDCLTFNDCQLQTFKDFRCQSVTVMNFKLVDKAAGHSPWDYLTVRINAGLEKLAVPENNDRRFPLLLKMLE